MLDQGSGTFDDMCTHAQLLELISGKKNAAYTRSSNADSFIRQASANIDSDTDYVGITDIHIRANENPTHNPNDRNIR
jgi:hypothetical protein